MLRLKLPVTNNLMFSFKHEEEGKNFVKVGCLKKKKKKMETTWKECLEALWQQSGKGMCLCAFKYTSASHKTRSLSGETIALIVAAEPTS